MKEGTKGIIFGISTAINPWWLTAIFAVLKLNEVVDDVYNEIPKDDLEAYDS